MRFSLPWTVSNSGPSCMEKNSTVAGPELPLGNRKGPLSAPHAGQNSKNGPRAAALRTPRIFFNGAEDLRMPPRDPRPTKLENVGIDPTTSRMRSERSTI